MPRGTSAEMMSALRGHFHPVVLLRLDWPDGVVRAHSGLGVLAWDGTNYLGAGGVGGLSVPGEGQGLAASRAVATLIGVPPEVYAQLAVPVRGRAARIWAGCTTEPGGNVLVGEPAAMFSGYVDSRRYTITPEGEDLVHAVLIEMASGPPARSAAARFHSLEDQQEAASWDTAGELLLTLERNIKTMKFPAKS